MGKNLTAKRLEVLSMLWNAGVKAETLYVDNPRTDKAFDFVFSNGVPLMVIIGEQEIEKGIYKIRSMNENIEYEVSKDDLIGKISELVAANPILLAKDIKKEESKAKE
jgi:histidyl-tRNA synthetase